MSSKLKIAAHIGPSTKPWRRHDRTLLMRFIAHMPRPIARLHAALCSYFWLPCPLCGRMMSGAEWDGRSVPYRNDRTRGLGYCHRHPDDLGDNRHDPDYAGPFAD